MILDLDRAVYVSGFLGSASSISNVCGMLEKVGYDKVEGISFANAITDIRKLRCMMANAEVWTHSAGMVPVDEGIARWAARPTALHSVAAPLPTSRTKLVGRAVKKSVDTERYIREVGGVESDLKEVVSEAFHHPVGNFWPLINGRIPRFDSVDAAVHAQEVGVQTRLAIMGRDGFRYAPDLAQRSRAVSAGVIIKDLAGLHDHLPIFPEETILDYLNNTSTTQ